MLDMSNNVDILEGYYPTQACIILIFTCNAMCDECCFECGPKNPFTLTEEEIINAIDRISEIPSINYIIWTGGEAFLKYDLLLMGIKYAKQKGIYSRVVSNGYWVANNETAKNKLIPLINSGLTELNVSTGDSHQAYVPINRVLNAATCAADLGIISLISVEESDKSVFSIDDINGNQQYLDFMRTSNHSDLLKIIPSIWVSFHRDQTLNYDKGRITAPEISNGCESLFTTLVVDPKNVALSCCGLSVEYIQELQLGEVFKTKNSLKSIFNMQKYDFMKQWLFVDGPIKVLDQVVEWNPSVRAPNFLHYCQVCAFIFNEPVIKETIIKNYQSIIDDVQLRFINKIRLKMLLQNKS